MALVNLVNMTVLDNPASFGKPFQFEITFECLQELEDDLEWKVIYVGSAEDSSYDQTLEEVLVGPIPVGVNKFVLQADPPAFDSIPEGDVLGVTVVLVTCSYREKEFVRVGYYVNNEYAEEFDPEVGPPKPLDASKVTRQILADKPRVTRFPIEWGNGGDGQQSTINPGNEEAEETEGFAEVNGSDEVVVVGDDMADDDDENDDNDDDENEEAEYESEDLEAEEEDDGIGQQGDIQESDDRRGHEDEGRNS